jgi:DDE superfamily endonuclease
LSTPRALASPNRRSVCRDVRDALDGWGIPHPPCWHDGPERPSHRPTDPEDQQEFYSGKQTCHTINNLLVIDETCQMCFLSPTSEGKANAKILAELEGYTFPPGSSLYQDMGVQG